MAPKARKTLAVPELLEMILLNLPNQDLLLAQRVNKAFHDVISQSSAIQRKLFYRCDAAEPGGRKAPILNPFLERIVTAIGRRHWPETSCIPAKEGGRWDCGFYAHYFRDGRGDRVVWQIEKFGVGWHCHIGNERQEYDSFQEGPPAGLYPVKALKGDSWRNMWATNLPCPMHAVTHYEDWPARPEIKYMPPARLGEWVDALRQRDGERVVAGLPTFAAPCTTH